MVRELLRELDLDKEYTIFDVRAFGYEPDVHPSIWIEVFDHDPTKKVAGVKRITRFIKHDVKAHEWGELPKDYPVIY